MNTFDLMTHAMIALAGYLHWCNRPWVRDASRKVVKDYRLGKLGMCSIWCGHPGTTCSCKRARR